ncbi:hypothetical protein L218DRAFT_998479 [Marasmius fiardii PR-910]|nr:hypothetical protein L218DRAFT_998479 [Marasmius fiardii PR-910]
MLQLSPLYLLSFLPSPSHLPTGLAAIHVPFYRSSPSFLSRTFSVLPPPYPFRRQDLSDSMAGQETGLGVQRRKAPGPKDKAQRRLRARFSPTAVWTTHSSTVTDSTTTNEVSMSTNHPQTTSSSFNSTNLISSTSFSSSVVTPTHTIVTNSPSFVSTHSLIPPTTQSAVSDGIDTRAKAIDHSSEGVIMGIAAAALLVFMAVATLIAAICRKRTMKARIHRGNTPEMFGTGPRGFVQLVDGNDGPPQGMRTHRYAGGYERSGTTTTIATPAQSHSFANVDHNIINHTSTSTTGRAPLSPITFQPVLRRRESCCGPSSDLDVDSTVQPSSPTVISMMARFDPTLSRPVPDGIDGHTQRWTGVWKSIDWDIQAGRGNANGEEGATSTSGRPHFQPPLFPNATTTHPDDDGRAALMLKVSVAAAHCTTPPPKAIRHSMRSLTPSMFTIYDPGVHNEHSGRESVGYPYENQKEEFREDSCETGMSVFTYLDEFPLPPDGPSTSPSSRYAF